MTKKAFDVTAPKEESSFGLYASASGNYYLKEPEDTHVTKLNISLLKQEANI